MASVIEKGKMRHEVCCPVCGEIKEFFLTEEQEERLSKARLNGSSIQYALPDVSPEIREMLISGICPECFEEISKPE